MSKTREHKLEMEMFQVNEESFVKVCFADPETHNHGVRVIYGSFFKFDEFGFVPNELGGVCLTINELLNTYHSFKELRPFHHLLIEDAERLSNQDRSNYKILVSCAESCRRMARSALEQDCEACAISHPSQRRHRCMTIETVDFVREYLVKVMDKIDASTISLDVATPLNVVNNVMQSPDFTKNVVQTFMIENMCTHSKPCSWE